MRFACLVVVGLVCCNSKHGDAFKIEQVVASGASACAVMKDGAVRCWGLEHGAPSATDASAHGVRVPTRLPNVSDGASVCVSNGLACVRHKDGRVSCTGTSFGVDGIHGASAIACNHEQVCVITSAQGAGAETASEVLCAGDGQPLHAVPGAKGAVTIAAGGNTTCVTFPDGTAKCWGRGTEGQLGNGHFENRSEPDLVATFDVRSIALGEEHGCAVLRDETVVCFGADDDGQLGDESTKPSAVPRHVAGVVIATDVACGAHHTCARMGDSTIRCWGKNDVNQSSITGEMRVPTATLFPGLYEAENVALGDDFTCVRMKDGWLRCFGVNDWGQLADGTTELRNVPTPIRY